MSADKKVVVVASDRYSATGTPRPDPTTVCLGPCEGMGYFPSNDPAEWPADAVPDEIGYVFVTCPDCKGSRLRCEAVS